MKLDSIKCLRYYRIFRKYDFKAFIRTSFIYVDSLNIRTVYLEQLSQTFPNFIVSKEPELNKF